MITQSFDLNLIPESSPVVVHCDQYDKGTGRLVISLYDENIAYSPSGTAKIQGVKPDGKGFEYDASISGNVVTANLTEQMSAVAGRVRCQIVVTETTGRTGSFAFILDVQPSALPLDTDISESDYQLIEQALEDCAQAVIDSQDNAEDSEAWAVGERGGIPVDPSDETYHNNSKWWAEQSAGGATSFADLTDVSLSNLENGQIPQYNSTSQKWENENLPTVPDDLNDLSDVSVSSVQNGQVLKYNSTSQEWENANESGGASDLDDLTDVSISSPTNGQVLKYNSTSQEWENANESGGGGGDYVGLYGMTEIQSSDGQATTLLDLDTYTTVGNYFCNGKAKIKPTIYEYTAPTVSGATQMIIPEYTGAIFILYVRRMPNNDIIQELYIVENRQYWTNEVYSVLRRYKNSSGWTNWSAEASKGQSGKWPSISTYNLLDVLVSNIADGDVLTRVNGKWSNVPINKVTSLAVDLTGWTQDTTSQSGTTLYKKQISLNHVYVESPTVDIGSSGVLPTVAEQESYNLLQYVTVDDTVPCLYLYASAIPTTAFYISVVGVD